MGSKEPRAQKNPHGYSRARKASLTPAFQGNFCKEKRNGFGLFTPRQDQLAELWAALNSDMFYY